MIDPLALVALMAFVAITTGLLLAGVIAAALAVERRDRRR